MIRGQCVTAWDSTSGANLNSVSETYTALFPGVYMSFSDATGQPAANILPDPNAFVCEFLVPDEVYDQMVDDGVIILWASEVIDGA